MARRLLCTLAVLAAALAPGQARAAVPLAPCGKAPGLQCAQIPVPLDRSGSTPGALSLHVEVLPARGTPVGTFFLIAGGPGQGSARAFDLGSRRSADFMRALLPRYTLVAVDNRGTGASGALTCPRLQKMAALTVDKLAPLARDCAAAIGRNRQFYATRDHAEDLEAVRVALGLGKIALFGVSYGTKLALAYALAHPDHVERLLLDSVLPVELPDPWARDVVSAMPQTLAALCAGARCRGATPDFRGDVAALANKLEAHPIRGSVPISESSAKKVRMTGEDLLGLVVDTDLSPGLAAELPAAVHAARKGYTRPLLRLFALDQKTSSVPAAELSAGLYAATTCADGQFPWAPTTPVSDRRAILRAAIAALAPGSFGPFGKWAARLGTGFFCELWPTPVGQAPLAPGPYPNVPVLAVSGGLDFRTPTANALAVLQHFPQGHLLVAPGVGHSVLTTDLSFCSQREVRYWLLGLRVSSRCPRAPALVPALSAFPRIRGKQPPRSTLVVAAKTVREAEAAWAMTATSSVKLEPRGLYGGKLLASSGGRAFRLLRYSIARGVRVTGNLRATTTTLPFVFKGTLAVSGPIAASGTLHVSGSTLSGVLGGRRIAGHV
ncbi:MAG: alpha/beta hydrolase [Actinomycetota bacterium]|nr:alpha/beta hydrolase [Actinomycetota bacterium]